MTGEWETIIPDVFNPKKRKVLAKEEEKALARNNEREFLAIPKEQLEKTKNTFQEIIDPKINSAISGSVYEDAKEEPSQNKTQTNEKGFSSPSSINSVSTPQKKIKEKLAKYYYEDGAINLSEDEIRRFIKKEVRKELRKALPYEIKKHKEQRQKKLFQNILLGCGAWFLFMIMLS